MNQDIKLLIEQKEQELVALKKRQKTDEEEKNRNDMQLNLSILKKGIEKRKDQVRRNDYSKNCIVAKFIDTDMIPVLESIYNLLNIMDKRIATLEDNSKTTFKFDENKDSE